MPAPSVDERSEGPRILLAQRAAAAALSSLYIASSSFWKRSFSWGRLSFMEGVMRSFSMLRRKRGGGDGRVGHGVCVCVCWGGAGGGGSNGRGREVIGRAGKKRRGRPRRVVKEATWSLLGAVGLDPEGWATCQRRC